MRMIRLWIVFTSIFLMAVPLFGQDMRAASKKAKVEYEAARAEARVAKERIFTGRTALQREVDRLKRDVRLMEGSIKTIEKETVELRKTEEGLAREWSREEMDFREFVGTVRVVTRDLQTILRQSQFSAGFTDRLDGLDPLLEKGRFPGMDEIKDLVDLFFQEMALSGEVVLRKGTYVDRSGVEKKAEILTIGKFTAAYRDGRKVGFLRYSQDSWRLFALSALPSWSVRRNLRRYMEGKDDAVTVDLSGGVALRRITHKPTLVEQVKKGGPIVWPILLIGLAALILVIERAFFLKKVHANTDRIMGKVNELALQGKWQECDDIVKDKKGRPVHNVLRAGLNARAEERETQESILQEAILKELPRLERFLPTLNIMGAIAPLLGLLGTVTGMISTFHVITLYGTGDPRMMSGGISEALVTTMLGLAVAIPIMLIHTFLSRRVDHIIGDMEEKAVALTNIIHREITVIE